jgi:DNA-binding NarL/FixJ family response regulator/signal transduction histidine kinase
MHMNNPGSIVGAADGVIGAEDVAQLAQRSLNDIAAGLECTRLVVLTYSSQDGLLRGVRTAGFEMPGVADIRLALAEFPAAEQALRTRQIRPLPPDTEALPAPLRAHLRGELVVVPIVMRERPLAVLVAQPAPNVAIRSPQWQERAEQLAARGAIVAELVRVSAAYQDERRLRQATQATIAAILEGQPLSEIAGIIAEQIAERLSEDRVGLFLVDAQGRYRPAALRNVSAEYAEGIAGLRPQATFSARAQATHLPYFTPDALSDPQVTPALRALFERENIRSLLIALLHHEERIAGALVIYPRAERRFTPREMTLLQALADQATLAVAIAQELEQQRDSATVEERSRLAREIHDTVAQSLAGVLMQVEMAETYLGSGDLDNVRIVLASARTQSKQALEDTRRAVQGLAPPSLEQVSISDALKEEARAFAAETGIETPYVATGDEQPLTGDQRVALLRIAQEALNNARKHAGAQRVRIGLQFGADRVVLIIDDDGAGFDVTARAAPDATGGYGLFGMEERARQLGGDLQIDSTPGWGTRIRAALPYRAGREGAESRTAPRAAPSVPDRAESSVGALSLRVLVADDHAIVRKGLREILEVQGGVQVVGEAENGAEAAEMAARLLPDVVLMDLQMPEVDGLEGLRRLHAALPELPVIVLTTFETESSVAQALAAGARGYLLKDTEPSRLIAAIRSVHRGESQFSSSITDHLASLASGRGGRAGADGQLNDREREVLVMLADGARNKEIAAGLFITVSTVEKHVASLFHKLDVSNRAEAVRAAVERGLISISAIPSVPRQTG